MVSYFGDEWSWSSGFYPPPADNEWTLEDWPAPPARHLWKVTHRSGKSVMVNMPRDAEHLTVFTIGQLMLGYEPGPNARIEITQDAPEGVNRVVSLEVEDHEKLEPFWWAQVKPADGEVVGVRPSRDEDGYPA